MYVLADLEWFEDKNKRICLTQISMRRVYDGWQNYCNFYRQIQPLPFSFPDWSHVSFTGGSSFTFLTAKNEELVFQELKRWLWPSDIICWWHPEAMKLFEKRGSVITNKQLVLTDLVRNYMGADSRKNPYLIGTSLALEAPGSEHDSRNDTEMIRRVLECIKFPQPIPDFTPHSVPHNIPSEQIGAQAMAYHAHIPTNTIHKKGCPQIPAIGHLKGYNELTKPVKKGYIPCSCIQKEFRSARRQRNQDIIDRTEYCFLYSPDSRIFHRRDCKLILNAKEIRGSVHYYTCSDLRLQPCKICNPSPEHETTAHLRNPPKKKLKKKAGINRRVLSEDEQRAMRRLRQAKEQRTSVERNTALTNEKRETLYTLSQPSFAFFAAKGYKNFHLRHCKKLSGLPNVEGFARYDDARRFGYHPCKCCKPDPKYDIAVSLPIYSADRKGESARTLEDLCLRYGYGYWEDTGVSYVKSPVGIWKIGTNASPYRIDHINLVKTPDNRTDFHRQPRLFLSLRDVFYYIKRHDDHLTLTWQGSEYVPQEAVR